MAAVMATIYLHLAEMRVELVKSLRRRQESEAETDVSASNTTW
jgi:hypothetical protein